LIADLQAAGCGVTLLSGDASGAVRRVAEVVGIADARANATPQDKHEAVRGLQATGKVVAMVGDGVNDAPVLALAEVSVAMAGGAELARTQADMVLLAESLEPLRRGLVLARFTLRVIRQNLGWSFLYNFVALPLAMTGFVTPWLAGIGMSGSSLLVVLNSLRLQRQR
jgi:Cu2+-exporting ATPase